LGEYLCCQERKLGQRLNIIVLAEGSVDLDGNLITAEAISEVILIAIQVFLWLMLFSVF